MGLSMQLPVCRSIALIVVLCAGNLLSGCATVPTQLSQGASKTPGPRTGAPYRIKGVLYVPHEQPGYDATGIASWYGPGFHGRKTATGEIFDQNSLSAAHATLPIPANVRVTNLDNGRSLVVRVNDRGPFHDGRIIDLSARGAELLGYKAQGTAHVRVQYIGPIAQPDVLVASSNSQTISNNNVVSAPRHAPVLAMMSPVPNPPDSQRVQQPASDTYAQRQLALITAISMPGQTIEDVTQASDPVSVSAVMPDKTIESPDGHDAPLERAGEIASATASFLVSPAEAAPTANGYFVQAGTFADAGNAQALLSKISPLGNAAIVPTLEGRKLYRVRVGPIDSRDEASGIMQDLIAMGVRGAKVVEAQP